MNAAFFDRVRAAPFGGRLTSGQVDGLTQIITYATLHGVSRLHLGYILATIFHETAFWMQPIREGARRYGLNYTDKRARRAVANAVAKGIIKRNYALPDADDNSFYGRGLVQITHKDNYAKYGLEKDPERALEWAIALDITFRGMRGGMFTGKSLSMIDAGMLRKVKDPLLSAYTNARGIINGDIKTYGVVIAKYGVAFYSALEGNYGTVE